ncbi:phage tail protein [Acetobacter senegalensis]|uniref:phage tail protein n=1 Tax=Acetobacter senegalensis TaxID=446692 RepID=UPI00264C36E4|nr:phage tail protein [Acetobacter senegalensis]MDN7354348.1 phage tail protein [Acetobacter senegalensis]
MTDIVNQIRNEITATDRTAEAAASAGRNIDAVRAGAAATRDTLTEMGDAGASATRAVADGADGVAQSLQEAVAKASAGVGTLRANLRNLKKEEADLQAQLDGAAAAGTNTEEITQNLSRVQGQISTTTSSLSKMRQEQQAAKVSLEAWNGSLGQSSDEMNGFVGAVAQATVGSQKFFNGLTSGSNNSLKAVLTNSRALGDELSAVLLKANAAEERMAKLQVQLPAAVSSNQLSQQDADAALAQAQSVVDKYRQQAAAIRAAREETEKSTKAIQLEGYQVTQLVDEGHKFLDMVLAGGSPLTSAFYQLPNAIQAAGGKTNALLLLRNALFGPAGIAAAAGAAGFALYKMGDYAEDEASKLLHLQQQLRGTRDDAASMADAITSASKSMENMPGWDKATARTAATAIGSTYNFSGDSGDIQSLSNIARDYGAVFGTLEDGLKAVTTAMQDPTSEIEALYKQHLPGVDQQLVEQVRRLQAAGEQGKAYALVIDRIQSATHDAYENGLTPFQRSLEDLKRAADPLVDTIKDLSLAIGQYLVEGVTDLLNVAQGKYGQGDWQYAAGTTPVTATGDVTGSKLTVNPDNSRMVGLMQINTDYKSKYDPTTLDGNIDEGMYRLSNFLQQTDGDLKSALALYNGAKPGSPAAKAYLDLVGQQQLSNLSPVVSGHFDTEGKRLGYSQGFINIAKLVGLAESSGKQWSDQSYRNVTPTGGHAEADHATSPAVIDNGRSVTGGSGDASGGSLSASWTGQQEDLKAQIQLLQTERDKLTVGTTAWKERDEALTQAKVALANTLSPQQQITQGLQDGLTPLQAQSGYWRNMAEVVAQFGTTARGTGIDQAALSQALIAKQQQLAAAYDDGTVAAQRQAKSQQAIADSAGGSNQALQHAINYQQAYNEALEDFDPNSEEFVEAVNKRTAALDKSTDADQKRQMLQQNSQLEDNLTYIQAETASLGQNADQRQVGLAVLQKDLELHRQYGAVIPDEALKNRELTESIAQATVELQHHQEVLSEVTSAIGNMSDQLFDGVTQGFLQGTSAGVSFKSMLQALETQAVSLVAKFALINPLLNSIDGGTRTTLSDISDLFDNMGNTGKSESGLLGGISQAQEGLSPFEAQNMKKQISSSSSSGSGNQSWLSSIMGQKIGGGNVTIGSIGTGIAGGLSVGSMLSSVGGGSYGTIGSLAGTALGTGLGAWLGGPVGAMVGGTVLGGLGGLIGSLFAKKHAVWDTVSGVDGALDITHTHTRRASDDVTAGLQDDLDSINQVLGYTGATADDGIIGEVGHQKKGKNKSSTALEDILPDIKLSSSDATFNMALQQLMPSSFSSVSEYTQDIQSLKELSDTLDSMGVAVSKFDDSSHVTVDHFNGYTGDMATALSTLDGQTLSTDDLQTKFDAIKEFVGTTMPGLLDVTAAGSESLIQQVDDLKAKYQDAANTAASYGLDAQNLLDKGNAIAAMMLDNERTTLDQSDQSVQARYMAATGDQEGADLLNQQVSAAQEIKQLQDNWRAYLGDNFAANDDYQQQLTDLEKTQAAERLQIQQEYQDKATAAQEEYLSQAQSSVASAFSNLADYVQGLGTSDASPLSVQDQYKLANDNFDTDYQAAMGGDYDALTRLQSESQTALSLDQQWLGSGTDYAKAYQDMLTKLQAIGTLGADTFTANLAKQLAAQQVDATLQVKQEIQTMNATLQRLIRMQAVGAKAA